MSSQSEYGVDANRTIFDAIQRISQHGRINKRTNVPYGTGLVSGYVVKIHDNPSDELYGTVDVKEDSAVDDEEITKNGYHEGVRLNAIQSSDKASSVVPTLYSDVLIARDPETHEEYVVMTSHVDVVRVDSREEIVMGVSEREPFDTNSDSTPDLDDLELTGLKSVTTFTKDKIVSEVADEKGNHKTRSSLGADKIAIDVDSGKTTFNADASQAELKRGDSSASFKDGEIYLKVGGELIKIASGGIYVGAENGTSHAVLGEQLGAILCNILDMIGQIKTSTQLGPQPPLNIAQFIATKAQVNAWTKSVSNFLSPKVNIQK